MRQSDDTIQQFIRRFDDTLAFGVTNLGMTAVDDETQRIVFLSAIRKVSALESFWRNETTRTDPGASREELTSRADNWDTRLRNFLVLCFILRLYLCS